MVIQMSHIAPCKKRWIMQWRGPSGYKQEYGYVLPVAAVKNS
jgi:hypothetical protein